MRRLFRLPAVLAAALLVFGNTRALLGVAECAQHSMLGGSASHEQAPAAQDHQHHATQDSQQDQSPCTCLDHCSACPVVAMPGLDGGVIAASLERPVLRTAGATTRRAERFPHQLPFATAPPAIA